MDFDEVAAAALARSMLSDMLCVSCCFRGCTAIRESFGFIDTPGYNPNSSGCDFISAKIIFPLIERQAPLFYVGNMTMLADSFLLSRLKDHGHTGANMFALFTRKDACDKQNDWNESAKELAITSNITIHLPDFDEDNLFLLSSNRAEAALHMHRVASMCLSVSSKSASDSAFADLELAAGEYEWQLLSGVGEQTPFDEVRILQSNEKLWFDSGYDGLIDSILRCLTFTHEKRALETSLNQWSGSLVKVIDTAHRSKWNLIGTTAQKFYRSELTKFLDRIKGVSFDRCTSKEDVDELSNEVSLYPTTGLQNRLTKSCGIVMRSQTIRTLPNLVPSN